MSTFILSKKSLTDLPSQRSMIRDGLRHMMKQRHMMKSKKDPNDVLLGSAEQSVELKSTGLL